MQAKEESVVIAAFGDDRVHLFQDTHTQTEHRVAVDSGDLVCFGARWRHCGVEALLFESYRPYVVLIWRAPNN